VVAEQASPRQSYTAALVVLAIVFFMWGFATVLNHILVPHFKSAFGLDYAQSLLVQLAFYLGYLIMAVPAAKVLERTGYKLAVVLGLLGMALSAVAFVPAAMLESYDMFLVALFLLASSITLLQVAANPYVAVIGSPQTASSRLNLVQAFNSLGTAARRGHPYGRAALCPHRRRAARAGVARVARAAARPRPGDATCGPCRARAAQSLAAPQSHLRRAGHRALHDLRDRHRLDTGQLHLAAGNRRHDPRAGGELRGALLGWGHGRPVRRRVAAALDLARSPACSRQRRRTGARGCCHHLDGTPGHVVSHRRRALPLHHVPDHLHARHP